MNEPVEVGLPDEPPKDGTFVGWKGEDLTDEEIAEGNRLGEGTPDVDYIEVDGKVVLL